MLLLATNGALKSGIKLEHPLMGVVIRDVTRGLATWARARREGLNMAEDLTCRESDYDSDRADSLGSSKSESELSLSCDFSPFDSGSEGAIATVEPYQYEPVDSHSSGGSDSREGSSDEESAGAERLLNTEWLVDSLGTRLLKMKILYVYF